jgi:hypothetical protein
LSKLIACGVEVGRGNNKRGVGRKREGRKGEKRR